LGGALSTQPHRSDPRILSRRTLQRDHRILAELLQPGQFVLDVGCGTGTITCGIAAAVGTNGSVVGVDRDESLLELARREHAGIRNLRFVLDDATSLRYRSEFDIVTSARTLQWISDPALAISRMKHAVRPGGILVILDYNHSESCWEPSPPAEFSAFYQALLAWRAANHWDNEMADHLPDLFRNAGLQKVQSHMQDEVVERGDADFAERTLMWIEVIETLGQQLAVAGYCAQPDLERWKVRCELWVQSELKKQRLALRAVTGRVIPVP
jgi:ubiquinone/menaquinone biosynthesis C-methylase UbiE